MPAFAARPPCARLTLSLAATLCLASGCKADPPPPPLDAPAPRAEATVRLAGDGLAGPLTENLARTFRDRVGGPNLEVEAPLTARGAARALEAGLIDAVVQVLPADAPTPPHGERIARTRPLWVAGPGLRTRHLTPGELAAGLRGTLPGPEGEPLRFQVGAADDPRLLAFAATDAEVGLAAQQAARRDGAAADPRATLRPSPQHIGLADSGLVALLGTPVWPIRYGLPVVPLDLWVIHSGSPPPQLQAFLAFLRSPGGREQVVDLGYDLPPSPR